MTQQLSPANILAALRDVCAALYPEEQTTRVIVADAGLDERQIAFSARAETNWHAIWLEAIRQDQVDTLLAVIQERYSTNPALQAALTAYQHFLATGGRLNAQALLTATADAPAPGDPPYQGMAYYDVADADRFFGREALTAASVDHLRHNNLLAVVGASGSGKSSLVRAGVLPALQGKQPLIDDKQPPTGSARWAYHLITPTAKPLESLAASLTRSSESVTATSTLIDDLRRDGRSLHLYARRLVSGEQRLLLLVDQFEELFTLCKDRAERQAFVENLLYAVQPEGVVTLIVTLRADFYHHCADFPALRTALETQQRYIGAMTPGELRRAIEEPAHAAHWSFQPGLVEQLLHDVGDEPGALPLLSHALLETWQRRRGRTLTLAGYRAAGGVQGAIAKTADDVFNRFTAEQKSIARILFLRLTELGEGVQDTRRRVRPAELKLTHVNTDEVQQVLGELVKERLVITDHDEVQVAHEALIRTWETLREWLADDREGHRIQRRLTEAANQWVEFGKEPALLYRGVLLQQAQEWLQRTIDPPNQIEMEFLQESQKAMEAEAERTAELAAEREANRQRELKQQQQLTAEQRRRAQTFRWALIFTIILLFITGAFAWYARNRQIDADQKAAEAFSRQLAAQADAAVGKNYPLSLLLAAEAVRQTSYLSDLPFIGAAYTSLHNALGQPAGVPLLGHKNGVLSVAFSKDGKWLASGGGDGTLRVWQADEWNEEPLVLHAHENSVESVAFSPDGKWLASGGDDGTLRVWQVGTWAGELILLREYQSIVEAVAFSSDGKWLASGSSNGTLLVWQVGTWTPDPFILHEHKDAVRSVAFSPDGKWLASGSDDNTVRLWQVGAWKDEPTVLRGHEEGVLSVAFSGDGKWLASGSFDQTLRVWQVGNWNGEPVILHGYEDVISSVAFSRDGKWLASCIGDNIIRVWQVGNWNDEPLLLRGHETAILSLAFSGDGKWLASGSDDSWSVGAWKGEPVVLRGHKDIIWSVAFSPDGEWLASGSGDKTVQIWSVDDWAHHAPTILHGHEDQVWSVAFSNDSKWLASASWDKTVQVWSVGGWKPEPVALLRHMDSVRSVAFSSDGKWLASGSDDSAVRVWLMGEWMSAPVTLHGHEYGVDSIAFSSDGKWLASGSRDKTVRVWSVGAWDGKSVVLRGHEGSVNSVVFSSNSKWLASGSDDDTVRVWPIDAWSGKSVVLRGHEDAVRSVVFSNDNKWLASGSEDGTVRVWQVGVWEREPIILRGHEGAIESVTFSSDGKWLSTGSNNGTLHVWTMSTDLLLAQACRLAGRNFSLSEWLIYLGPLESYRPTCPTQRIPVDVLGAIQKM